MAAEGRRPPQGFLLTPKLLAGLDYNCHVHVLQIFNGPLISAVSHNFKAVRALPSLHKIGYRVLNLYCFEDTERGGNTGKGSSYGNQGHGSHALGEGMCGAFMLGMGIPYQVPFESAKPCATMLIRLASGQGRYSLKGLPAGSASEGR